MVRSRVQPLLDQNRTTLRTEPQVRFGVHQVSLNWTVGQVHGSAKVGKEPDWTEPWQHYPRQTSWLVQLSSSLSQPHGRVVRPAGDEPNKMNLFLRLRENHVILSIN